jgi:putative Mn2+ efflux pump MntP
MLAFIGGKMIADSFKEEDDKSVNPRDLRTQLVLAVATSIDALAVGISYACTGYNTLAQLTVPLVLIGVVSFGMSVLGFSIGVRFGDAVNRKMRPELLGGIILLGIGVRILIEHLGA